VWPGRAGQERLERELPVHPRADQGVGAPVPERDHSQELPDQLAALVLQWHRRHAQPRVLGEQGDDRGDVAGLVSAREAFREAGLGGRVGRSRC
jgi:hypothetical protein